MPGLWSSKRFVSQKVQKMQKQKPKMEKARENPVARFLTFFYSSFSAICEAPDDLCSGPFQVRPYYF